MYSLPSSCTFAALTIASAASTAPTNPLVSTIPSASRGISLSSLLSIVEIKSDCIGSLFRQRTTASDKKQETQIFCDAKDLRLLRSEEHTSELQSPYVISYAVFC